MTRNLQGRVAMITGASGGLGRATALALADEGVHVSLGARRADLLAEVADEARRRGVEAVAIPTDVTRPEELRSFVSETLAVWGHIDLLVANAGQYIRVPVPQLTREVMEESMAVNFYGVYGAVLEVLPHMLSRGAGHLVLVGSIDGKKALPPDAPYAAAKFALAGLGDVMRQELDPLGVRVTGVFPGRIDTPFVEHLEFPLISPRMSADKVAQAIVRAVAKDRAEVVLPWRGRGLVLLHLVAPRLADRAVRFFRLGGWERETESSR